MFNISIPHICRQQDAENDSGNIHFPEIKYISLKKVYNQNIYLLTKGHLGLIADNMAPNTNYTNNNTGLLQNKTDLHCFESALCHDETGMCKVDTGLLHNETGLYKVETGLYCWENALCHDETGLCFGENALCHDETGLYKDDTGLCCSDTGLCRTDTGLYCDEMPEFLLETMLNGGLLWINHRKK